MIADDAPHLHGVDQISISGLTSDSRAVKPGFLFAALPGTSVDGAKFIPQAIASGAAAVLAQKGVTVEGVPHIEVDNPRLIFARMAARFFGSQPDLVVAVTGTNGKTSVASFVREIWGNMGFRAASLGTIGVVSPSGTVGLQHTTPDPVRLHEIMAAL
ncbi:MAG: UDP-N-acetylmuramoyl-L-alanyl-D-glutamate--2,6-diaminopimelate ligase, partial [Alphaproteobacteria bacterium]|nr:UDP-N-acetylmuramoyl-L-alanyl-D-glutamate--2,6-diaminopimelate ligase [Alphaproteobacteria bacterium]